MPPQDHRIFFLAEEDYILPHQAYINPADSHHIRHVLRLRQGDSIVVATTQGKFKAIIVDDSSNSCLIHIQECLEPAPEVNLKIYLVQALPKIKKMDEIVEKATEFGVSGIQPVFTVRSLVSESSPMIKGKHERWSKVALAASKQSRRFNLPALYPCKTLPELLSEPFWSKNALKILFWELEEQHRLLDLLSLISNHNEAVICIGPEGGFTLDEIQMMQANQFKTCSLGKQILRTETAGPFAVGFLMSVAG